jgi:hypothetical protein
MAMATIKQEWEWCDGEIRVFELEVAPELVERAQHICDLGEGFISLERAVHLAAVEATDREARIVRGRREEEYNTKRPYRYTSPFTGRGQPSD